MSCDKVDSDVSSGPWGLINWMIIVILVLFCLGLVVRACSIGAEVGSVTQKELGPTALLRKYEWFKDAAAQLDKKRADIAVYQKRIDKALARSSGDRFAEDRIAQWETEQIGVQASYNSLAAEYNAQMAKINWRFTNIGRLPEGATEALPREFKPYTTE